MLADSLHSRNKISGIRSGNMIFYKMLQNGVTSVKIFQICENTKRKDVDRELKELYDCK